MFYTLSITLCLAVMFLVCAAAVLLSIPAIKLGRGALEKARPHTQASVWFLFRVAPFALAAIVSLGLALPAFLRFEPPSTEEMINGPLLALAAMGAAVLAVMAGRLARMLYATRMLEQRWLANAQRLRLDAVSCPVYVVSDVKSLLAVTGIFRPQVFVSVDVAEALSEEELSAALAHELAHVRHFDNLRQLLLKSTQLPIDAWRTADAEWTGASEIAADETAVRRGAPALELSSALIKVGRLSARLAAPKSLAASHLAPCGCGACTGQRAARLRALLENESLPVHSGGLSAKLLTVVALVAVYVACLGTLLPAVHEALELLVR